MRRFWRYEGPVCLSYEASYMVWKQCGSTKIMKQILGYPDVCTEIIIIIVVIIMRKIKKDPIIYFQCPYWNKWMYWRVRVMSTEPCQCDTMGLKLRLHRSQSKHISPVCSGACYCQPQLQTQRQTHITWKKSKWKKEKNGRPQTGRRPPACF